MSKNPDDKLTYYKPGLGPYKKPKAPRSSKRIALNKLKRQLMTCLDRDTGHLMDASYLGKLTEAEASDLRGYLKLVKDLMKQEVEENGSISEAELERKASESEG